ncbi:MAG: hypothetical protein SF028_01030 [Candidatus Sumerlaeia bacterium]|nr:hypothetical protein [Candidatus Sumerlaeia bacterium]
MAKKMIMTSRFRLTALLTVLLIGVLLATIPFLLNEYLPESVASQLRLLESHRMLLSSGVPLEELRDPFGGSCYKASVEGEVWSVGPDAEWQDGRVSYDPTNGASSEGDILLGVFRGSH